jgi:hypothetical protein
MAALIRRWIAPRQRPMITFMQAVDPWADHPLWGATGPYAAPLYSPTVTLPIVRPRGARP